MADWLQTVFNFLPLGRYNASPPTLSSGAVGELQCDAKGRLLVSVGASVDPGQQFARTRYVGPIAGAAGALARSGACRLIEFVAQNRSTNDRFLLFLDQTAAPTSGVSVPKLAYKIPAGGFAAIDYHLKPHDFNVGVFWASSTGATPYFASADTFFIEVVTEALT
jgi:hypothetical protein